MMKRRDFCKNTGMIVSSSAFLGTPFMLGASEKQGMFQDGNIQDDDLDARLEKPLTAIVIGAGDRGTRYSAYALEYPGSLKIVGVSDINKFRCNRMADRFNIPDKNRFGDWSEVFKIPKFADFVLVTTPDALHYGPCMKALEMGYHVLLEKPAATSEKDCIDIKNQAHKYNRLVAIGHVLRYSPYWRAVKDAVASGKIGEVVSFQHMEPVDRFHFAHAYVRGNWRNSETSTPMVLSKSCHDLDLIRWIIDKPCKKVTAFGDLRYFNSLNAPKEATVRCLDCPLKNKCVYSAIIWYYERRNRVHVFDLKGDRDEQGKQILNYLRTTNYGRCVYYSDNNQPDHFVMNMLFEDGTTASFSMEGHTNFGGRRTKIMGTKGDIVGDMRTFTLTDWNYKRTVWDGSAEAAKGGAHGGGDLRLVKDLILAIYHNDQSLLTSTIDASMESHVMGFKGEESRLDGGALKEISMS